MRSGVVGVGFMSWIHYLAYQRSDRAEMVAFCSRDPGKRAGDWRGIQGNFGPPGEQIDVSGIRAYQTLDEMLADDTIDLMWGDCGMLYFWIRRDDLASRCFDHVWMTLQCC